MQKGVSIFHNLKDLPPLNDNSRTAVVDLSDAGEIGYLHGYSPEDLIEKKMTAYEIIMVDTSDGSGSFQLWEKMLKPKENDKLVIYGCPERSNLMNETLLHGLMLNRIKNFFFWLKEKQNYENVYVLVSRVPTALNKACFLI